MDLRVVFMVGLFAVCACGSRGADFSPKDDAGADGSSSNGDPATDRSTLDTTCNVERVTRASTCESSGTECSIDAACGTCGAGETCTHGRCLHFLGLPVDEYPQTQADLGRGLYESSEGMECAVDVDGDLERVEAGISSDGKISAVVMTVYAECGGRLTKVAEQTRATSEGTARSLGAWTLDPPVFVKKGTSVRVLFHAEGSGNGRAAVQQIVRHDAVSSCHFYSERWGTSPGGVPWDFVGRVAVHPR